MGTKQRAILLIGALLLSHQGFAAEFTVDSTEDAVDISPGDGVCATATGQCTLRAAIMETNALPGADIIDLPAGTYTLSIEGRDEDASLAGDLDITDDLTIDGAAEANAIIDANEIDRVLHIIGSIAEVSDVTVINGKLLSSPGGGGIFNIGTLTLTNTTISANNTEFEDGGGILNPGTLTIDNSTIRGNRVGGTVLGGGGGISTSGTLILTNSTLSGNVSGDEGGGIQLNGGTLTITNSTVSGNIAQNSDGGGIANFNATLTLTNSTVSGNVTGRQGGGIWNGNALTLISGTVSNNSAALDGGGISNDGTADVMNTIIADSLAGGDCTGPVTSRGHNLDSDGTCNLTQPNDLPNTDPVLGPLANNGGPTMTHALLAGSPAIDAGEEVCLDAEGNPLETDQRGISRPLDGDFDGQAICDIGAYEAAPWLAAAVLPGSRSVLVGSPAAAFATILNTGAVTATECTIASTTNVPADFLYQTTDPLTNEATGTPNTAVDIASGAGQTFLVAFTPNSEFFEEVVRLQFACTNTDPAPVIVGVNTLLLSASTIPIPDIVAANATINNDGIVTIPGKSGSGVFAVATVNVGAAGLITVSADTGSVTLPVNVFVCETNPNTSVCLAEPEPEVTTTIESNATPTFGVFVVGEGTVPFDPATNRIFVRFTGDGGTRGSTSVGVRTL